MSACSRCGAETEEGDLRCPVCALALPARSANAPERPVARIIRCDQCGASLSWSAEAAAPSCMFCGSVMHIEIAADPLEQAERYLPFQVDSASARAALRAFLQRRSFFRPSDLASVATVDSLQPLWWPGWIFSARSLISWTADSNAGSRRSSWAPHAGQAHAELRNIGIPASRGLTVEECEALLPGYRLESAEAAPRGPEGAFVERFDVTRSGARRLIERAIHGVARARIEPDIPGTRHRKVNVAVLLEGLDTDRYAFPAWVLAYRYREQLFRVVVHGQDPSVLLGKAPTSPWKVLLAVLGVAGGLALLLTIVTLLSS